MFVWKILLGLTFCLWIFFLWSRRKFYMFMLKVPGPMGLPLIGVLHKIKTLDGIKPYAEEVIRTYKNSPLLGWVGPFPILGVYDPQTAQDILTSPHCVNKPQIYVPMRDAFGDGLLTIQNPDWQVHRKLLNPAFSVESTRGFVSIFNQETQAFLKDFEPTYEGEAVNMLPLIRTITMASATQTTMGFKKKSNKHEADGKAEKLFSHYLYFSDKIITMVLMPWLQFDFIRKFVPSYKDYTKKKSEMHYLLQNEIDERLELLTKSQVTVTTKEPADDGFERKKSKIFFDLALDLLRSGKLAPKHVEDHSKSLLFGAIETTATTISHAMILLAMNPKYQDIAFEGLFNLYPERDNVYVTDEDLQHLVYLDLIINETLRLIPTVAFLGRIATNDVPLSNGVTMPSGTQVVIDIFHLHRDENIWGPNALEFNPENFLPENMSDKHPYAFIPFAKGIRNCIGWRYGLCTIKTVLAIMLRKYRFTTTGKFEDLHYSPSISIKLIDPPLLKLHLREK